ncbi:TonB-dependent receptor plug domain-containing protein, partial [Limnohabitans sp.]|uniref:TonB-dependent receptor plug domain-containing protein n=1 Tax=Limnohabitans sp. TaxID=1907725 RepID=UPI00391939FB
MKGLSVTQPLRGPQPLFVGQTLDVGIGQDPVGIEPMLIQQRQGQVARQGSTQVVDPLHLTAALAVLHAAGELEVVGIATLALAQDDVDGPTDGSGPGLGGGIRMRGLGSGYTQILLDGQRVPPGFSIESLTPEQIERIEILRAPTAETGARAIGGTINIVLREGQRGNPDDLKLTR